MNAMQLEHPPGKLLTAYGLGQLREEELAGIDGHLADCAVCRQVVEGVVPDTLLSLLRSAATEPDSKEWQAKSAAPAAAPPSALMNHPRYRVGALLGIGGMGAVYKAEHLLMERPVALKVLNRELIDKPATIERFGREVRAAARLTHPNIVAAFDAEQAEDVHFLVMEYVEGISLARLIAEGGPLPVPQACDYVRQAALGLQHAHERGMVHRDIKPQNLMLTPSGQVKILDFGLARFVMESVPAGAMLGVEDATISGSAESLSKPLTQTGIVMGTPDYIAPEQARDSHLADIRADIYSLGCTLYDLLAGHAPFPEGSAVQKVKAHLARTPRPLKDLRRDVPPELVKVIERMMAKDPTARFQSPVEVAAALMPFQASINKPPRRKKWSALAAGFAFVAALVAGVIIYVQTDNGTIIIETKDDTIAVMIQKAGGVKIVDQANKREYHIRPGTQDVPRGAYKIEVTEPLAGLEFQVTKFELKRGQEVRLMAWFVGKGEGIVDIAGKQGTPKFDLNKFVRNPGDIPSFQGPKDQGQAIGTHWFPPPRDIPPTQVPKDQGPLFGGKPASFWLDQLQDANPKFRVEAVEALGMIAQKNKELIPVLAAALKDQDPGVGSKAASALGHLKAEAVPALLEVLKDKTSATVLKYAAKAIGIIGPEAKAAVPLLVAKLKINDWPVRQQSIIALGQIGPEAKSAIPVMIEVLGDYLKALMNNEVTLGNGYFGRNSLPEIFGTALEKIDPEFKEILPTFIDRQFLGGGASREPNVEQWQKAYETLREKYQK